MERCIDSLMLSLPYRYANSGVFTGTIRWYAPWTRAWDAAPLANSIAVSQEQALASTASVLYQVMHSRRGSGNEGEGDF